jgi:hypothetical protein
MSHSRIIQDANYHRIGTLQYEDDGKVIAFDENYHRVGHYDPQSDCTYDANYSRVGNGDQTASLLWG